MRKMHNIMRSSPKKRFF